MRHSYYNLQSCKTLFSSNIFFDFQQFLIWFWNFLNDVQILWVTWHVMQLLKSFDLTWQAILGKAEKFFKIQQIAP